MESDTQVYTSDEIIQLGMMYLIEKLGHVNAEHFINAVRSSCPDYTMWRRQVYDDMTLDEINDMIRQDSADNPFERSVDHFGVHHIETQLKSIPNWNRVPVWQQLRNVRRTRVGHARDNREEYSGGGFLPRG